jgi:hypothetical protein
MIVEIRLAHLREMRALRLRKIKRLVGPVLDDLATNCAMG